MNKNFDKIAIDGAGSYAYEVLAASNYDGDSFNLFIVKHWDFGFDSYLTHQMFIRARLHGVDTPELRDVRPRWKAAARLAKAESAAFVSTRAGLRYVSKMKRDRYGRSLGDFVDENGNYLTEYLLNLNLAVHYSGQAKSEIEELHKLNIDLLEKAGRLTGYLDN